jgi:ABC-2 type transport system permease protein
MHIKKMWMFKASFVINSVALVAYFFVDFALIWVMIYAFRTMGGWNPYEIMLLFAMNLMGFSLGGFFIGHAAVKAWKEVRDGTFDDVLTKPLRTLPYLCFRELDLQSLVNVLFAAVLLCIGFGKLGTPFGPVEILKLLLGLACGGAVYAGLELFATAPIFIIRKVDSLSDMVFALRDTAKYPLSILPFVIQLIMTLFLPYAMMGYFPVQSIIGKQDYLFFGSSIRYLAPLIAFAFFALAMWFFNFCLKRYNSTGS